MSLIFFFVSFLSSIVFHGSVVIHYSFRLFLYPRSDLLASVSTWLKLSMFIYFSSFSTLKRFFNSSLITFSVFAYFSFVVSNRCCLLLVLPFVILRTLLTPPTHDRFLCQPHDLLCYPVVTSSILVYDNMVDLANRPLVWRSPCGFMDISVHK